MLVSREQRRGIALVVVRTCIHGIPVTQGLVSATFGVVVVAQTQHMAELMAECANTIVRLGVVFNLTRAGIAVQTLAIEHHGRMYAVVIILKRITVRPNVVIARTIRLLKACVEDIYKVDVAIVVVVE